MKFAPQYCFLQSLVNSGKGMTSLHFIVFSFLWHHSQILTGTALFSFFFLYKFSRKLYIGSAIGLYLDFIYKEPFKSFFCHIFPKKVKIFRQLDVHHREQVWIFYLGTHPFLKIAVRGTSWLTYQMLQTKLDLSDTNVMYIFAWDRIN